MIDIVFPKKNEQKFINLAEKLQNKELCFVYSLDNFNKETKNKIKELQKETKVKLGHGILSKPDEIKRAKQLSSFVITESSEKNQHVLEKLRPNALFNLETEPRKDKMHYRVSGLNQVLCKLATKNNITIMISFSNLLNPKPRKRQQLFGRIIQNHKFCKKYKTQTSIASFAKKPFELRAKKDLDSLSSILQKNL